MPRKTLSAPLPRLAIGLTLSALSAELLLLSLPPYGVWPLALAGLIPAVIAQYRILPRRLSSLAPAVSIGGFIGVYVLALLPNLDGVAWLKALPAALIVLIYFTDMSTRDFNERTGYRWFVLEGAIVWVGIEMIRNLIPTLGTGGFIAYAYSYVPWLIQPTSVFGIFGLGLITMLLAYALALLALACFDCYVPAATWPREAGAAPVDLRQARRWLVGTGAVAVAWSGLSLALLAGEPDMPSVRVAAVQPQPQAGQSPLEQLAQQTRQAAAQGAQIVVWPEGILPYDPRVNHTAALQALAAETNTYLVFGYYLRAPGGLRNEATVLSPGGKFLGVYGKDHPVVWAGETSLTRGTYPTYRTPLGTLGTIICYDLIFVDTVRKMAAGGAQLIGVPSNDWPELSNKEYTHLVFRAVENRVAMVKADTQYDSVIIDAYGRILASHVTALGTTAQPSRTTLIADVPLGAANALQIQLGDWIGWLCLAGLVLFSLPHALTRRLFERRRALHPG